MRRWRPFAGTKGAALKTLIIAEAGVNHNGDLALAWQLIDVAAEAGADLVKFQTFSADRLVTTRARKADYQKQTTDAGESQHAMIRRLELTRGMHEELIAHCGSRRIGSLGTWFMCKVASGGITDGCGRRSSSPIRFPRNC